MIPEMKFPSQFKQDMSKLQQSYVERLKKNVVELQRMREPLMSTVPLKRDVQSLYTLAQLLADSGITFGFPEISAAGQPFYLALRKILNPDPDAAVFLTDRQEALHKLQALEHACQAAIENGPCEASGMILPEPPPLKMAQGEEDVYVIAPPVDRSASEALAEQIAQFGYMVYAGSDEPSFRDTFAKGHMKAAIFFSDGSDRDLNNIRAIRATNPRVPVIVMSPYDDFEVRLRAARIGAQGYFSGKPEVIRVVEKIERLADQYMMVPDYHVLIVDDDEVLLEFYRHALQRTGLKVSVITDQKDTAAFLAHNEVDLLLIDNAMPVCSGQELAAIVRQYDEYLSIPIVFMSHQDEIDAMQAAGTGPGIDDFLVKPFVPDQLLGIVRSRARRAQELKSVTVHDTFTGLFNHEHFTDMLATEIKRSKRTKDAAVYAVIDIDGFKQINGQYGHHVGDQIIKMFSHMLRHHLRTTDIIGRCGGEAFGIILPGCNLKNAQESLEKFRAKVTESFFTVRQQKVRVTFSGGVTLIDGSKSDDDVIKAAEEALYQAKQKGRNQVVSS
ncbi:MAG: diguanylate cyclase [Alphaproteobacteria bacterium]